MISRTDLKISPSSTGVDNITLPMKYISGYYCLYRISRAWVSNNITLNNVITYPCPRYLMLAQTMSCTMHPDVVWLCLCCNSYHTWGHWLHNAHGNSVIDLWIQYSLVFIFTIEITVDHHPFHLHNENLSSLNPLPPSDVIWWQRYWSTRALIMAWCLTAPNHYLNQSNSNFT